MISFNWINSARRGLRLAGVLIAAGFGGGVNTRSDEGVQFKFSAQTLTVPKGFRIEQVAAPPLVNRPISLAFDEKGFLYATDSSGFSGRADKQFEQKPHRIVRLEDVDGDGRYDKSVVYADKVMFPQGAMVYEGSLYVAAPPHIWKFTDADGDGIAERREIFFDGGSLTGCANDVHGPYCGPDGWFYWTKGEFSEQKHVLGNGRTLVSRAAHIFRARPDGSGLEPVLTGGMNNPVGVAFTPTGDRILSGTFFHVPAAGKRDGLIHAIYGGVYGKVNPVTDGHVRTGDLMPVMTLLDAAASGGSTFLRSGAFGAGYANSLFVCHFNLQRIMRHDLRPQGVTYMTQDTDFVTSDNPNFRPTDVLEDDDGSMLLADTGGWYNICCPSSQLSKPDLLGGIYRVRRETAAAPPDGRGRSIAWASLGAEALAGFLADSRPSVVDRAIHELGLKGTAAVAAIGRVSGAAAEPAVRRNAVWALSRIGTPTSLALVRRALDDGDDSVARTALHVVSLRRDADAVGQLLQILDKGSAPQTRLAAEALGRIGNPRAVGALFRAVARLGSTPYSPTGTPLDPEERILEHSFIYALIEIGRSEPLRAYLSPPAGPREVRAALVALDQMEAGELLSEQVVPWLSSNEEVIKRTASWIASHRPAWGDTLKEYYAARLAARSLTESESVDLRSQLISLAASPAIQALLAETFSSSKRPLASRRIALAAVTASGQKQPPQVWLDAFAELLGSDPSALGREAMAAVRALPPPKTPHEALASALARAGRNESLPADLRLAALAAAPSGKLRAFDGPLFDFVRSGLERANPRSIRADAAAALAAAPLDDTQRGILADGLNSLGALEIPVLLPAFTQNPTEQLGLRLVASLKKLSALAGVRVEVLKSVFSGYPAAVQAAAQVLLLRINADLERQSAEVDSRISGAHSGDVRRGQEVFSSDRSACLFCHSMGYRGGRFGPDLSKIGRIRSERDLLEAVLYPSATFVRGYEPFTVKTRSGETLVGLMHKETDNEIVLAMGPESERALLRSDVVSLEPGAVSPMPPGMGAVLSTQEISDVIAFLKSRQ